MTSHESPALVIAGVAFYDAPSEIEGSPYWVDLWASVNGYRIGLQVKPQTFRASSLFIYAGKAKRSQAKGHELFQQEFRGKVITLITARGKVDQRTRDEIALEVERLQKLPAGPYPRLAKIVGGQESG
jgi:hypothetical protein